MSLANRFPPLVRVAAVFAITVLAGAAKAFSSGNDRILAGLLGLGAIGGGLALYCKRGGKPPRLLLLSLGLPFALCLMFADFQPNQPHDHLVIYTRAGISLFLWICWSWELLKHR